MSTITTRAGKGSPLTNAEVDSNFNNLNADKLEASTAASTYLPLAGGTLTGDLSVSGSATISVNSASDALRITQTGTGNALVVEDSANPDSTPFVVDASGNVIRGYTSAIATGAFTIPMQLHAINATAPVAGYSTFNWADSGAGPGYTFYKSRGGVIGTPAIVSSGDNLGRTAYYAYDGASWIEGARVQAEVDGTPGTNDMPGRLVFSTTADGASSPTERMRIDNAGRVGIGSSSLSGYGVRIEPAVTGATGINQVRVSGAAQSDVTSSLNYVATSAATAAAAFTLPNMRHFLAVQGTIGAGSTVTNQFGYFADSTLTGATNNYGFFSNIAAPTSGTTTTGTISSISSSGTTVTVNHNAITYTNGQTVTVTATANITDLTSGATCTLLTLGTTTSLPGAASSSVTFADSGDIVTYTAHGMSNGTPIFFSAITSTTGISINTIYYVVNATTNAFQVASTVGGSPLALTTDGTGTCVQGVFTATGAGTGTGTVTLRVQGSGKTVAGAASGSFTFTTTTSQTFAAVTVTGSVTVSTRYNFYANGTAKNIFAGQTSIGGLEGAESLRVMPTASAVNWVQVTGSATGLPPSIISNGSDTNIDLIFGSKGTGAIDLRTNGGLGGVRQFYVTHTASAVNYFQVSGATTGNNPWLAANGSDTNIGIRMSTKGSGSIVFQTGGSSEVTQFNVAHTDSAVNYLQVTGAATGAATAISAQGSDTNVQIGILAKGASGVAIGSYSGKTGLFVTAPSAQVNYLQVDGANTGGGPNISAQGTDTNISIALTPKGTGGVGIGTATPRTDLELYQASTAPVLSLERGTTSMAVNDVYGGIEFYGNDSNTNASGVRARIQAIANDVTGGTRLAFATAGSSSTTLQTRLSVYSSGCTLSGTSYLNGVTNISKYNERFCVSGELLQTNADTQTDVDITGFLFAGTSASFTNYMVYMPRIDVVGTYWANYAGTAATDKLFKSWAQGIQWTGTTYQILGAVLAHTVYHSDSTNFPAGAVNASKVLTVVSATQVLLRFQNRTSAAAASGTDWIYSAEYFNYYD